MPDEDRMYITKRPDGNWNAKREGADRASAVEPTQGEAEARGKEIVRNDGGGEVIIHRPDGKIRDSDTIDKPDPFPPRDTKH